MIKSIWAFLILSTLILSAVCGFAPIAPCKRQQALVSPVHHVMQQTKTWSPSGTGLFMADDESEGSSLSTSDQQALGIAGTISALVVFISEYTLAKTGCGLPAGPFGVYGLVEGLSYLGVVGIAGYSAFTKVKTGSGLPAGPAGLLGAAEGLSFLAILVGLVVLALQVTNYGYIPNAVPVEGGLCA